MRGMLLSLTLGIVAFTTGCPQGPSKNFPGDVNSNSGKTDTKSLVTNINHYLTDAQTKYEAAKADPDEAQRIRNDAIDDVLAVINDNYTDYINRIEAHRSTTEFVLDVIDLGTGAATGIVKGERPNQILGIALTAFRGGRTSAELNFYKQQTAPILINKMDDNRAIVLADILRKKSDSTYTMKGAIRDLVDYYNAGTLVRAFTELSKTTAAQAQASQAVVRTLSGPLTISAIPSLDQDTVLKLVEKQKISLAKQIAAAIKATPDAPPGATVTQIADAKAARTKALQPVRLKLETIWKNIESDGGKFDAAINTIRANAAANAILANIAATPTAVTEGDYLTLLFKLQGALNKDLDLNKELLGILTTANS